MSAALKFGKISEIIAGDSSTYDKCFLTFDIDWACDGVLKDTIALVEKSGLPATWFITHETPFLSEIRSNPNFELGIHPNFNFLLDGQLKNGKNAEEIIDKLLAIVPEATAVRSHSLVQSERFVDIFASRKITHLSNYFIPSASSKLKPWELWRGITAVPHCWQDNVSCMMNPKIQPPSTIGFGAKVFNFHPIHAFLNTECLSRYEATRHIHHNPAELLKHQFDGEGARSYLINLLDSGICA